MGCGKASYPKVPEGHSTVVFDLDGTLAESTWPNRKIIGEPLPGGVELLHHYASQGYTIVVDTARPPIDKEMLWAWIKKHGLPVDRVRCGKKIVAGLYIDDRGYRPSYVPRYQEGNMGSQLLGCSCVSKYQDSKYGSGRRVHNMTAKRKGDQPVFRCTICGRERVKGEK